MAYVLGARVAQRLIQFADAYVAQHGTAHSLWECELGWSVKASGVKSWMPYRQYGEHGGLPNMEHAQHGFNPSHQADTLYGPLHFLPVYARGSRLRFGWMRMKARARGIGRLLFHRYVHRKDLQRARANGTLGAMLKFAIVRHAYLFEHHPVAPYKHGRGVGERRPRS